MSSVFKKYDKNILHTFSDTQKRIYFSKYPTNMRVINTYKKWQDKKLFDWLKDVIDKAIIFHLDSNSPLSERDIKLLKTYIHRCTREIMYLKLRQHKNFVQTDTIQCIGCASMIIAMKVFLEYDWGNMENIIDHIHLITDEHCKKKLLLDMENDLLETTDWKTCYKTQKRLGHIPKTQSRSLSKFTPVPLPDLTKRGQKNRSRSRSTTRSSSRSSTRSSSRASTRSSSRSSTQSSSRSESSYYETPYSNISEKRSGQTSSRKKTRSNSKKTRSNSKKTRSNSKKSKT